MTKITLPYDRGSYDFELDTAKMLYCLQPTNVTLSRDPAAMIADALARPIAGEGIAGMIRKKQAKNVVIVITDITRPSPDNLFLRELVKHITAGGVAVDNITVVVAVGTHRPCTEAELRARLGAELYDSLRVINSNPWDKAELVYLGISTRGCPIWINKVVVTADCVISTGIIEPHLYAGYSGGRKSIAIGTAGEETISFQHDPAVFADPHTRIGNIAGNVFHDTATEIAKRAGLDFIVNAVLDTAGNIVKVVAGEPDRAFREGVAAAARIYSIPIAEQADIAIVGVDHPKDANLFQATRVASYIAFSPFPAVKRGGLIIIPATTPEGAGQGLGERRYYEITRNARQVDDIVRDVNKNGVPAGGHRAYIMALTLKYADVAIVGSRTPDVVKDLFLHNFVSLEEALAYGYAQYGDGAKITVIPHGLQVVTSLAERRRKDR